MSVVVYSRTDTEPPLQSLLIAGEAMFWTGPCHRRQMSVSSLASRAVRAISVLAGE